MMNYGFSCTSDVCHAEAMILHYRIFIKKCILYWSRVLYLRLSPILKIPVSQHGIVFFVYRVIQSRLFDLCLYRFGEYQWIKPYKQSWKLQLSGDW